MATFTLIFGGVCFEVGGSCGYAFPSARIAIGISTLALPSCAVSPTLSSLVRVWISPVARVVSSSGFPIRRTMILDGLLGLLCVKGYMGNPLMLRKK